MLTDMQGTLTWAKADERETLPGMLDAEPALVTARPGQTLIGDKKLFRCRLRAAARPAACPAAASGPQGRGRAGWIQLFRPLRQTIESVNETFKGQLDLERHRGRTPAGVMARVLQRILALTAAIWHNDHTGQPIMRSLIAYDH